MSIGKLFSLAIYLCLGTGCVSAAENSKLIQSFTQDELKSEISPGLGCSFAINDILYLIVTTSEALIKSSNALSHFNLDEDHALSIINYGGSFGKRDIRVIVDRDDKTVGTGEESSTRTARLTVRIGDGLEQTLEGDWTCGA